jgi:hypothetical protein
VETRLTRRSLPHAGDQDAFHVISDRKTGTDLVFLNGWTDGSSPVWLGRAADGSVSCYVADFTAPDLADATPVR